MAAFDFDIKPRSSSSLPGLWWMVARLAVFAVLLIAALGMLSMSLDTLCFSIAVGLDRGVPVDTATLFEPPRSVLPEEESALWNHLAARITEAEHNRAPVSLALNIDASGSRLVLEYVVTGPTPLVDELAQSSGYRANAAVQQMLGAIRVNGESPRFEEASHDVPGGDEPAQLRLRSVELHSHGYFSIELSPPPKTQHLLFAAKEIAVSGHSVRVEAKFNLETLSSSASSGRYKLQEPRQSSILLIASTAAAEEEPLAKRVQRFGVLSLPVVGELVVTLLWASPLLLLLVVNRRAAAEGAALYRTIVILVVGLQLALSFLASAHIDPGKAAQASPLIADLVGRATGATVNVHPLYDRANAILITLLAGWLWPALVARATRAGMTHAEIPRSRSAPQIVLAALVSVCAIVFWVLWLAWEPASSVFERSLCLLGIVGLLLFWAMWEFSSAGRAIAASLAAAAAIALLAVAVGLPNFSTATPVYHMIQYGISISVVLLFGACLVIAFLRISKPLFPPSVIDRLPQRRWPLWCLALVAAFPTAWLADASQIWWGSVEPLAFLLRDLFVFAVAAFLLTTLQRVSAREPWPLLPPLAIGSGIVLALAMFYASSSVWFYFPIPLVLGFVLLNWFLFVPPVRPDTAEDLSTRWQALARGALNVRRLERTTAAARKGLEERLAKGEIAWMDFQEKLGPLNRAVETERRAMLIQGNSVEPVLFSFGPSHSAWANGRTAAVYSVFFGLPWILLSLRDLLNSPAGQPYVLLSFLGSAVMTVVRWTLYGFFFGYFYAYIRGRNGLQKALSFWLALVLPSALAALLSSSLSPAALAPLLFWTVQVFLHCVLLGLFAGELESLWKAGLSWRQLLEFHNLTALSAWGSTVLLALGTAVTTALSTGLGSLIAQGLKYAGVLPQGIAPGK